MLSMESVTVSELNRQTAKVLDRVKSGESLEISEYGRPVARITPVTPTTGSPLLDRMIPPTPPRDDRDTGISLSATLAETRDDERY